MKPLNRIDEADMKQAATTLELSEAQTKRVTDLAKVARRQVAKEPSS